MGLIETLVLVGHVIAAAALIGLILIQHGKGADAGASFGAGASQTVFGSQGSGSFLTRMTSTLAIVFFLTSFGLAIFAKQKAEGLHDDGLPVPQVIEVDPAALDQAAPDAQTEGLSEGGVPDLAPSDASGDSAQPDLE